MVAHIGFRLVRDRIAGAMVMLVCAYGAFVLAEALHVSGIIAALVAGLWMGQRVRREDLPWYMDLWEYKAKLANALLLLIAGISFQWSMFADQWLAMLIAIGAVSLARILNLIVGLHHCECDGGRVVQTSADFDRGASGGGLFDRQGRLVGILTFKASSGGNFHFR